MPSLGFFLNRTQELCEQIQALKFRAPGIFTNSFIAEPKITTLLKDAEEHELALYRIRKPTRLAIRATFDEWGIETNGHGGPGDNSGGNAAELQQLDYRPERVDGRSVYADDSIITLERGTRRTWVRIPHLVSTSASTQREGPRLETLPDLSSPSLSPSKRLQGLTAVDTPIDDVCHQAKELVHRYPALVSEAEAENLDAYCERFTLLAAEVRELQETVDRQLRQLADYSVALNDLVLLSSPRRGGGAAPAREAEEDIDEALEREERATRALEDQLELVT